MQVEVLLDRETVAKRAAAINAEHARTAFRARGRFILAVGGGHTPLLMLRMLGKEEVPWGGVLVLQVDERIAPPGDPDRNLTHLEETLLENAPINSSQIHPMPVEMADAQSAVAQYSKQTYLAGQYSQAERHLRRLDKVAGLESK